MSKGQTRPVDTRLALPRWVRELCWLRQSNQGLDQRVIIPFGCFGPRRFPPGDHPRSSHLSGGFSCCVDRGGSTSGLARSPSCPSSSPRASSAQPRPPFARLATRPTSGDAPTKENAERDEAKRSARFRGERRAPVWPLAHGITPWSAEPVMATHLSSRSLVTLGPIGYRLDRRRGRARLPFSGGQSCTPGWR